MYITIHKINNLKLLRVWNSLYYLKVEDWSDIGTLKSLINDGYLISISIDADKYSNLTSEDIWNIDNYNNITNTNHANTIVGYFDD